MCGEGLESLERAEAQHCEHRAMRTPWTQQVSSAAKPIPEEEVVCSLLCEYSQGRRMHGRQFRRNDVHTGRGVALCMQALAEGHEVPQHRQRLAALGASI